MIRRSPVTFFPVLQRQLSELLVHLPVEVISQEERPEAEERVHFLRLADSQPLPFCGRSVGRSQKEPGQRKIWTPSCVQRRWSGETYRSGSAGGICGRRVAWSRSPSAARVTGAGTWGGTEACSRCFPWRGCPLTGWRWSWEEEEEEMKNSSKRRKNESAYWVLGCQPEPRPPLKVSRPSQCDLQLSSPEHLTWSGSTFWFLSLTPFYKRVVRGVDASPVQYKPKPSFLHRRAQPFRWKKDLLQTLNQKCKNAFLQLSALK